jgi:hypothetical protein
MFKMLNDSDRLRYLEQNYKKMNNNQNTTLEATSIAFVKMAETGVIDDVTASEHIEMFAEWLPNVAFSVGALRRYDDTLYRCVQAHTSQEGWEPNVAVSLWSVTSDPAEEYPNWSAPVGAHDAYQSGATVTHNNKHWVSTVDGNVWEPGVYGWKETE